MRKVILFIASSLDGFIARKDGGIDWLFSDADYGYSKFYSSIDTVITGRKTYDLTLILEKEPFKDKKIYVFTNNLKSRLLINAEVISDPVNFVKKLKDIKGKNIWLLGGSEIITLLMNANLVDEIILSIHPIVLGNGIPLFINIKEIKIELVKSKKFDNGLLQLKYNVKN